MLKPGEIRLGVAEIYYGLMEHALELRAVTCEDGETLAQAEAREQAERRLALEMGEKLAGIVMRLDPSMVIEERAVPHEHLPALIQSAVSMLNNAGAENRQELLDRGLNLLGHLLASHEHDLIDYPTIVFLPMSASVTPEKYQEIDAFRRARREKIKADGSVAENPQAQAEIEIAYALLEGAENSKSRLIKALVFATNPRTKNSASQLLKEHGWEGMSRAQFCRLSVMAATPHLRRSAAFDRAVEDAASRFAVARC